MTYSQFFGKTITLDGTKEGQRRVSTKKVFETLKSEPFVEELRQKGFIKLTDNILKKYIDAFLDICAIKDKYSAYQNVNKLLEYRKIELKEIYNQEQGTLNNDIGIKRR